MAARMTIAIALTDAAVDRAAQRVVHGVDMHVATGSWYGVIGANGSGKTSLLRALAGRLPFATGACRLDGEDLAADRAGRARLFGFAPPADMLPDGLRVRDVLALVGGDVDHVRTRLGTVGEALGLDAMLGRWIGDCSAGMRQRISIATALAGGNRHVVLDEPFNWLDPVAVYDLRAALRARVDQGLTLVTALHDLGTLATVCDAGLMLADGRVAMTLDADTMATAARDPRDFERATIDLLRSTGTR